MEFIDIVIATEPNGPGTFFIEIEDPSGTSISFGQRFTDRGGTERIRIRPEDFAPAPEQVVVELSGKVRGGGALKK